MCLKLSGLGFSWSLHLNGEMQVMYHSSLYQGEEAAGRSPCSNSGKRHFFAWKKWESSASLVKAQPPQATCWRTSTCQEGWVLYLLQTWRKALLMLIVSVLSDLLIKSSSLLSRHFITNDKTFSWARNRSRKPSLFSRPFFSPLS